MGEVESEGQRLANEWADECVIAEAALAIDAALRRAKAEGWRDAAQQVTQLMIQPKGILDGDTLLAIIDRLDARAAQIEALDQEGT